MRSRKQKSENNSLQEQISRAGTPEANAAPVSAELVNENEAAAPLAPPAVVAPAPGAQGVAVPPEPAPVVAPAAEPAPAPAAGPAPVPAAGPAPAPAAGPAPVAQPQADPQDVLKFNNMFGNESGRKKFLETFFNVDKYQAQLNAAHLKFLSADTNMEEINKIHRYLTQIQEHMTLFNEQVALLKRLHATGGLTDPIQQAQPDQFRQVIDGVNRNPNCFDPAVANIGQRQTRVIELIAEANLIRNQNKYIFGKEKPRWTGDANTPQGEIDAELEKWIGAIDPNNPVDAQGGIQAGDDTPREDAPRTHNWAIYRMEVQTTSRNPQTIVTASLHKVDPAKNFSKINFHLDNDAIAKFSNDFFADRSVFGTRIPGNATTDWAARNIAVLLEKMTPNPDGSYPTIKINGGVENPPHSRAMPEHCIQALMLYCEFKGLKYQVRNADHVTISADQKKLMAKQWALKHPNDDQQEHVHAKADRESLASAMQASERAQAAAAPVPAAGAAGANPVPPGAIPPPPPPPPPRPVVVAGAPPQPNAGAGSPPQSILFNPLNAGVGNPPAPPSPPSLPGSSNGNSNPTPPPVAAAPPAPPAATTTVPAQTPASSGETTTPRGPRT